MLLFLFFFETHDPSIAGFKIIHQQQLKNYLLMRLLLSYKMSSYTCDYVFVNKFQ